jgi:hypothetical protein
LFWTRWSLEITATTWPATSVSRRDGQASSKSTPSEVFRGDVRLLQLVKRHAEALQSPPYSAAVLGRRADPEVQIARRTGQSVHGECIGSDEEVLSALLGQHGQHVEEVGIQPAGLP